MSLPPITPEDLRRYRNAYFDASSKDTSSETPHLPGIEAVVRARDADLSRKFQTLEEELEQLRLRLSALRREFL